MTPPRKHLVGPAQWAGLTRDQLVELGRRLFDRIESDKIDPEREDDQNDHDPRPHD